jgi:hypothetical protein
MCNFLIFFGNEFLLIKPLFQIPKTQYSIVPTFHYSPATAGLGIKPCFKKLLYLSRLWRDGNSETFS